MNPDTLPPIKVFIRATSAAYLPRKELMLWFPDPQAFSMAKPIIVRNVPRTILGTLIIV
jgi:hypothetical protein